MFDYSAESVVVLQGGEHIRLRPELYLGTLPNPGILNWFVEESLCLAVEEVMAGHCTEIMVRVFHDGSVTVRDNGRGLSMEPGSSGKVLAELLLTQLGACRARKVDERAKGACCHLGLVVVNALSDWLRIRVLRDGGQWIQEYRDGIAQGPFVRERDARDTGIELSFCPSRAILGPQRFDADTLSRWLESAGVRFGSVDCLPGDRTAGRPLTLHFANLAC